MDRISPSLILMAGSLFLSLLLVSCQSPTPGGGAEEETATGPTTESFQLLTSDGVTMYGELHRPSGTDPTPLILAFHQGGANARAEYAPIIPRLLSEGFAVMATDQRRGGDRFGESNRTAVAFPDQDTWFCEVYPDLVAALSYAESLTGISEIIAWGSSTLWHRKGGFLRRVTDVLGDDLRPQLRHRSAFRNEF